MSWVNREKKKVVNSEKYKYFREISRLLFTDGRFTIIMRKLYELATVGSTYEEIKQRGHLKRRHAMVCKWNMAGRVGISGLCWRCGDCLLDQGENKRGQAMLSGPSEAASEWLKQWLTGRAFSCGRNMDDCGSQRCTVVKRKHAADPPLPEKEWYMGGGRR